MTRNVNALRTMLVTLFTSYAVIGLTLLLNCTVVSYKECTSRLAYKAKTEEFLKNIGSFEDGRACERVAEIIEKITK